MNLINSTTNQHELLTSLKGEVSRAPTRTIGRFRTTSSWCLCGSWLILLLLSCQTLPQAPDILSKNDTLPLQSGAAVYLFADAQKVKPLLDILPLEVLNDKQVKNMIDKTNSAMAALFPRDSALQLQLTAWGNYPKSGARMALGSNKSWKKEKSASGQTFWYSVNDRASIAIASRQIFAAVSSADKPPDPFASGAKIPDGFSDFFNAQKTSVISCWIENPGPIFQQILHNANLPIRVPVDRLFISLNTAISAQTNQYEAVIRLQFENASQARAVAAALRLAGGFTARDPDLAIVMLFLANPPVQEGRYVDIRTGVMGEDVILQLFSNL